MMGGNQAYDSFMQSPSYLGVAEAILLVRSSLGSLSYEEELTVCFVKEPNSSEESALSFHQIRRLTNTNAAFTITNGLIEGESIFSQTGTAKKLTCLQSLFIPGI